MLDKLIVYVFCERNEIDAPRGVRYVTDLVEKLRQRISNELILPSPVNGNNEYPGYHALIKTLIEGLVARDPSGELKLEELQSLLWILNLYFSGKDHSDLSRVLPPGVKESFIRSVEPSVFEPYPQALILLTGKKYKLQFPYGVASDSARICLNRCLHKLSIWHETAHLLGANDHYDHSAYSTDCGHPVQRKAAT